MLHPHYSNSEILLHFCATICTMKGQIYKIHSDFCYIDNGASTDVCKVREVLKKRNERILVGDFVEYKNGLIEEIIPRKNYILRPAVANIDCVIVVSALKEPDLNLHQLDRYIALAKYYGIETKLCFNKSDLKWEKFLKEKITDIYKHLGFEIVYTSATGHKGIKAFEKLLEGKTSVLCGTSGAGKSSLINAVNPDLKLKTKSVSEKLRHGTHTTRHCEIIKINNTSRIVDTPGFSNIKFDFILPSEVDLLFDDIKIYQEHCKYNDCIHINEDGCNVLENIDKIDQSRYKSYLAFVREAQSYKELIKNEGKKTENFKKVINNKAVVKINGKKRQSARNTIKQNVYKDIEDGI